MTTALIPINYDGEQPTVSARDLHLGLGVTERFSAWFNRQLQYGFVKIGDNTYQVNVSLNASERLEIDSRRKTVKLVHTDGYAENVLWSAVKEYYIFEKIASGTQIIAWNGSFSFDLILIDKRSEPLWK